MIKWVQQKGKKSLILFVHGFLGGHSTWQNSSGSSFPEMLLENTKIKRNFDIAYFEYFTKISNPIKSKLVASLMANAVKLRFKAKKNLDIDSLGDLLYSVINHECADYESILIIAHSMGGLVTKSCILNDLKSNKVSRIKLFLSLAVPHQGSDLTESFFASLISNPQVYDLKPVSGIIDTMNKRWIKVENIPHTIYFYGKYDEIVNEKSAVAIDPYNNDEVACDDDHFTISKPDQKDAHVYFVVEKAILKFIEEDSQKKTPISVLDFTDKGQFDDMDFVLKLEMAGVHKFFENDAKNSFYNTEYVIKKFKPRNNEDRVVLQNLYFRIKQIYGEEFGRHFRNELEAGNGLVSQVHTRIAQEHEGKLKAPLLFLQEVHKKGMIHQLANEFSHEIWWSKEHDELQLNQFRKRMVSGNV